MNNPYRNMEINLPKIQSKFHSELKKLSTKTKYIIGLLNKPFSIMKSFVEKLFIGSLLISAAVGAYWIVCIFIFQLGEEINSSYKIITNPNDGGKWILGATVLCLPFIVYYLGDFFISHFNSLKEKKIRKEELITKRKELKEKESSYTYSSCVAAMNSIDRQIREIDRELEKIG